MEYHEGDGSSWALRTANVDGQRRKGLYPEVIERFRGGIRRDGSRLQYIYSILTKYLLRPWSAQRRTEVGQASVGQSELGLQARLRHVTASPALLCPEASDLAAPKVPLLSLPPGGRVILTPWAGRNLDVPYLGSTGISGTVEMLTGWLGGQCH